MSLKQNTLTLRKGLREYKNNLARRSGSSMAKDDSHGRSFRKDLAGNIRSLKKQHGSAGVRRGMKAKYLTLKKQGMA